MFNDPSRNLDMAKTITDEMNLVIFVFVTWLGVADKRFVNNLEGITKTLKARLREMK